MMPKFKYYLLSFGRYFLIFKNIRDMENINDFSKNLKNYLDESLSLNEIVKDSFIAISVALFSIRSLIEVLKNFHKI